MKPSNSLSSKKTTMIRSLLCWAFLVAQLAVVVPYSASQENVAAVVKRSSDAIVLIVTSDSTGQETALGSGFLVSADGKVVTNFHVIKGAHSAVAKLANGAFFPVDGVLAADVDGDLVLLKVPGKGLPFLTLDASAGVKAGDHVVAIGSPLGLEGTVSDGIVSAIRSETPAKNWIQTTAPVSHGNSGGPLLAMDGNVVGVITWGVNLQEGQNLNFAIPSDKVQSLLSMHEQLTSIDVVSSQVQRANSPEPERADSRNTGEQHAIEQLRAIAQGIKACNYQTPDIPGLPDRMVREGFKDVFGPPTSVIWDIESKQSIRSPYIGYVEYSVPAYMKLPPTDDYCNAKDIKKSECKRMWVIGTQAYEKQVNHPQQFRYEFDVSDHGVEFLRAFKKTQQRDDEQWIAGGMDTEGCAFRSIRSTLNPPVSNVTTSKQISAEDVKQALALYEGNDYVDARPLLDRACDTGNAEACGDLGQIYDSGWGITQDHNRAAALFLKACNAGNVDSCLSLGVSYGNGNGVEQDYSHARDLFSLSCDKGNSLGCAYLGDIYKNGYSVAQDYQRAVTLYTKSCESGQEYGYGCAALGAMYQNGYGAPKDSEKAKQLYGKACRLGSENGCNLLKSVQ